MHAPPVAVKRNGVARSAVGTPRRSPAAAKREAGAAAAAEAIPAVTRAFGRAAIFPAEPPQPPNSPPAPSRTAQLAIGPADDPLERLADRAADRAMRGTGAGSSGAAAAPRPGRQPAHAAPDAIAPAIVREALRSPGEPLDGATRRDMEARFGHGFGRVRVHADAGADTAARRIGALAYTVGNDIAFAARRYAPHLAEGRRLLAHELAHVIQQAGARQPWVQRQQPNPQATSPAPRKDYVFIMGADPKGTANPFFTMATRYFRAHLPSATFVDDKRNLADLLSWIQSNVTQPIGNLYIVSHGNEDGTLAFGLDSSSADNHMSVTELRAALHPSGGGSTSLASVASVIDAQTTIHIKGCDIGRTPEMEELIDEAFGGAGTVIAPTHEQEYKVDTALGEQARKTEHDTRMAAFTAGLPPLPPQPAAVDRKLTGDARKQAQADHDKAAAALKAAKEARKIAIEAEEKRIAPELDKIAEQASTLDIISGPMFQRPGTKLFTAAELQPEIDRLYGHLSETQRKGLAQRLTAPDHGGPGDQQGQKVIRIAPSDETFGEPASLAEAKILYKDQFGKADFTPSKMTTNRTAGTDKIDLAMTFTGTQQKKGQDPTDYSMTMTETRSDDAKLIKDTQSNTNNPNRYQWHVDSTHDPRTGKTTITAVGERVVAYLHHGSLDAGPHDHFGRPESDPNFYYKSVFAPPAPPAPPPSSTSSGSGKNP